MSRVFVSEATRAVIYVFADDHCPPHVHARHRGEGWIARVRFSYVSAVVELISIAPLKNVPLQRVVNRLLDDVSSPTGGLPAGVVDDQADDLLGEPMGHGRGGEDRASLGSNAGRETDRRRQLPT